ncbi:MAG: FlgD immunoglobulin-like domain containing protein, partial [Candidatus Krumholzibacteriota bacterium]
AVSHLNMAPLQCPEVSDVPGPIPTDFSLSDPWPNPFNPRVSVRFDLPEGRPGRLVVHDLRGNMVTELWRGVGTGQETSVSWNGRDYAGRACPSGTYGFVLSDNAGRQSSRVTGTLIR